MHVNLMQLSIALNHREP